jgi:hypothetical protein
LGTPNTSVTSNEGIVKYGDFRPKDGLQVTFSPKSSEWQFSVNSLLLQIPTNKGTNTTTNTSANANATSTSEQQQQQSASIPDWNLPWERLSNCLETTKTNPTIVVIILRSGKFAGAVFHQNKMLEHKTFSRYTRRAKAGGSQSSYDNKGSAAKSAGATMRRAGEQALKEDVRRLLQLWKGHIESASSILYSVPKVMRDVLFNFTASPLVKTDSRLLSIPFMVTKAVLTEVQVIHARCTSIIMIKKSNVNVNSNATSKGKSTNSNNNSNVLSPIREEEQELNEALNELTIQSEEQCDLYLRALSQERDERRANKRIAKEKKDHRVAEHRILQDEFDAEICLPSTNLFLAIRENNPSIVIEILSSLVLITDSYLQRQDSGNSIISYVSSASVQRQDSGNSAVSFSSTTDGSWDRLSILCRPENLQDLQAPLHVASMLGRSEIVMSLLRSGSDPGAIDARGRTSYTLAKDKQTRDAFRKYRGYVEDADSHSLVKDQDDDDDESGNVSGSGALGGVLTSFDLPISTLKNTQDDTIWRWDWTAAGIGPALNAVTTEEMNEKKENAKEKEKARKKRAKQRKQEQAAKDAQIAADSVFAAKCREEELKAAVEASRNNADKCKNCQKSLFDVKKPFDMGGIGKCCTADCAMKARRKLQAEAAERRLGNSKTSTSTST